MFFNFFGLRQRKKPPKANVLIVDPGHGGRLPGAISKCGRWREKDINLAVARYLREWVHERSFKEKLNLIPFATRSMDNHMSLKERTDFANESVRAYGPPKAVFVSIHTNARPMRGKHGIEFETYYYKGSGEGWKLASFIQESLLRLKLFDIPILDRGVKVGERMGKDGEMKPFYVLRHTAMTAALVELGFISDPEEAEVLSMPKNQERMASAILDGVVKYLGLGQNP